jgi:hypothetical protein
LTLRVATQAGQALDVQARVRGRLESGRVRVESFGRDSFRWMPEAGAAVSQLVFATVESVEVHGVPESMAWEVSGLDLDREDLTLLLPLWAGVVERAQAETILRQVAMAEGRFLRPFGLATIPCDDPGYEAAAADPRGGVHPTLNLLLGEAMVRYGLRAEAAELLQRSLRAGLDSLRRDRTFWQSVHPETGEGLGRRHAVRGAPPLSLLLDILGVGLRSPDRVRLEGRSAFDHPVVVRWRGLEIERSPSSTRVRFADEQSTLVEDEAATLVERVAEPEGAGRTT